MTVQSQEKATITKLLAPGATIAGRYKIIEFLAQGGMGAVYLAEQQPIGRKVALKVMKSDLVEDKASVKRFFREAFAATQLTHPNTITVYDYGEGEAGQCFIAMEFLDGESLDQALKRSVTFSLERAVSIISQVVRSLAEAHTRGVIHRDMKPENVFVSQIDGGQDFVKVLDFGIAKVQEGADGQTRITRMGYVCGTPEYMSPEQARGEELDGRTDLYALGVMLWEMLEGQVPFKASTPLGIVLKHQSEPAPPITADVPEEVKAFIMRAMSKEAEDRPASAEAFLDELLAACPDGMEASGYISSQIHVSAGPISFPDLDAHTPAPMRETGSREAFGTTDPTTPPPIVEEPPSTPNKISPVVPVSAGILLVGLLSVALFFAFAETDSPQTSNTTASQSAAEAPPTPNKTRLIVSGQPVVASIFEGETLLGNAPRSFEGIPGEMVSITIKSPGFLPQTLQVTYPARKESSVTYALTPITETMTVTSLPKGAKVFQGTKELGETPLKLTVNRTELPTSFTILAPNYEEHTFTIDKSFIFSDEPHHVELRPGPIQDLASNSGTPVNKKTPSRAGNKTSPPKKSPAKNPKIDNAAQTKKVAPKPPKKPSKPDSKYDPIF